MSKIHAAITAVNGYVPDYVLTNKELETMVDTNDEWIVSRTGIKERRILKGEGKATSDLAVPAVLGLLKKRGITAEEIDLIVFCTSTPDMLFPATANILADKIGAKNAWGFDLQAACSGFLFGLNTASQFIISGTHKKVLVVGADKMSSVVNYKDRNTCILFGDGCGAVLLEPNEEGMGIQDAILKTDGSGGQYLNIKGGGSLNPATHETVDAEMHYAYQEGRTVFKFAVTNMADVAAEIMDKNNLTSADINWLVPHQANKRIIDATAERVGLPEEKVMVNIQKYGNTTSATIPMCLWEWENQLKKGDNLILAAFGGGFTWGSIYLKWAY
ncbi:3-oxoacyl-(acyl carrier protein) synthase III [Sphingobacterium spiritivorum ATCC 33300]|uniref:Beta-ketoacyl-[acyl-carrier-protein] synthase III n=3 Tax=Sphingobacterium spiritivorum TaxID=258 RepID=D7VMR7_SPHSI|nr:MULTISPECIES: beta-ketoacyl-ACP synthase III [Sphingobacterium]EEI94027.1 3-oxoacyl-(acyl carrier protein) synthase III [Sphingobacterium spiritivorum ATCC 33300]EFK57214.1 3-oxoacyl-(acyl carrier protein) synthase III [Sphingobacterium spiritivorum ATCC 33861]QQS94317.1 ketoacyl-ACP synthase III [Sphingobacterium spiritivorum]QQT36696.1 ketoacyl-ACP synthase III [Sphingobacterium spiritivorum]WQD33448.1 beta-ketoacyl-ACP synthase III [Sphingobacterium spiritivorum]